MDKHKALNIIDGVLLANGSDAIDHAISKLYHARTDIEALLTAQPSDSLDAARYHADIAELEYWRRQNTAMDMRRKHIHDGLSHDDRILEIRTAVKAIANAARQWLADNAAPVVSEDLMRDALEELQNYRNDCDGYEGPEGIEKLDATIAALTAALQPKQGEGNVKD
jgi:hypothetical protein